MIVQRKPAYLEAWQLDSNAVGHWHKVPPFIFEAWKNEELFLQDGYYSDKPLWCIYSNENDVAEDGDFVVMDENGKLSFYKKLEFKSKFEVIAK